ncbi:MAG: hypothetical protein JWM78_3500 [Verrucomicrobiaceae bacterium]|nr:hypothetical protein [Verrucomicrobiaceae bacterium]
MESAISSFKVINADTFLLRAFGLLFRRPLEKGEALHLRPCNAIHTIGMRYAIDLVFLSSEYMIVAVHTHVGRFRMHRFSAAKSVLELRAGEAQRLGLEVGVKLDWLNKASVNQ